MKISDTQPIRFNKSELVNLSYSLKREIIGANRSGAYCNTTIVTANTRKYHGLLAVPVDAFGGRQHLLLSSLDETVEVGGRQFNLATRRYGAVYAPEGYKYITGFTADPVPEITYKVGEVVLLKEIVLSSGRDSVLVRYKLQDAPSEVTLHLMPFLAFRDVHSLTSRNDAADTSWKPVAGGASFCMYPGFPSLNIQTDKASEFSYAPCWYEGVTYADEYRRGFDCKEDLFVPGTFSVRLKPGESVVVSASVEEEDPAAIGGDFTRNWEAAGKTVSYHQRLLRWAGLFKRTRGGKKQITAGFSWLYTGLLRETLLALPGLTLYADGNREEFEEILDNLIADEYERLHHRTTQIEAPLLLPQVLASYVDFGASPQEVWAKYGGICREIIESYAPGVRAEVSLHPNGLLWAQQDGMALSWMNAYIAGRPVTPRSGYQVETNALWYNALCFTLDMEEAYGSDAGFASRWTPVRRSCLDNYQETFFGGAFLADFVDGQGRHDDVRPNQLAAVSLKYSPVDAAVQSKVMDTVSRELLTRRGIRTLSPRDNYYKGVYEGSQYERDLAYHGGSCWPFLLAFYVAAAFRRRGAAFKDRAIWLTEGFIEDLGRHGVGAVSELYDGDPPHEPHGAVASALSTAAMLAIDYMIRKYGQDEKEVNL